MTMDGDTSCEEKKKRKMALSRGWDTEMIRGCAGSGSFRRTGSALAGTCAMGIDGIVDTQGSGVSTHQ
jgi:hypothetical protein